MRFTRAGLTAGVAILLLVAGCGGGDDEKSSSTPSAAAPAPSSSTTSAASTSAAETSSSTVTVGDNLAACADAATTGLAIAGVGLEALAGNFEQADYDKTFEAGRADKLPQELRDEYEAVAAAAKKLVGKSTTEAVELTDAYTKELDKYTSEMSKVCT